MGSVNQSVEKNKGIFNDGQSLSPEEYYKRWMEQMSELEAVDRVLFSPVLIFRINEHCLALNAEVVREVTTLQKVHRIPYSTSEIIRGLVNVRGDLQIRVSLRLLLELGEQQQKGQSLSRKVYPRLVVIEKERQVFAFFTQEIYGATSIEKAHLAPVAESSFSVLDTCVKHTFLIKNTTVKWLDDDLIFYQLRKALQ